VVNIGPIVRGDGRTVLLWLTDPATGGRLTLSDKKLWFTAKNNFVDPDTAAVIRKGNALAGLTGISVVVPSAGQPGAGGEVAVVQIAAADTDALDAHTIILQWDGQVEIPGSDPVTPDAWRGQLSVVPDVTRSS
jgi:hypothetical protein